MFSIRFALRSAALLSAAMLFIYATALAQKAPVVSLHNDAFSKDQGAAALDPPVNLTATTSARTVMLSWQAPGASRTVEAVIGSDGGMIESVGGNIEFIVPSGAFGSNTTVRVTDLPIDELEADVMQRGLDPVGEPVDRAAIVEIEADRLGLPALVQVRRPANIATDDEIVFAQLLEENFRYWGRGTFSSDGTRISVEVPINAQQGLPSASKAVRVGGVALLREIQGNGIDDDGDGLVDEMELIFYPDRMGTGICTVTGSVFYQNGAAAAGAFVSIPGTNGLPVISIADGFGVYRVPVTAPTAPGTASFTVNAFDPATNGTGTEAGSCSAGGNVTRNIVLNAPSASAFNVTITAPTNNQTVQNNVVAIQGTVADATVGAVEILINGTYPPIIGVVTNGQFSVEVFLPAAVNNVVVLARNAAGDIGTAAVVVLVGGGTGNAPDIQVSLQWDKANDVDLYLVTPAGNTIYFSNGSADGGTLNIDQTSGTASGPEVISFPAGTAQPGRYGIAVQFFSEGGLGATKATLSVSVRGRTLGTFQHTFTVSESVFGSNTLADVDPASVWNVLSVDMPDGRQAPARPVADFSTGQNTPRVGTLAPQQKLSVWGKARVSGAPSGLRAAGASLLVDEVEPNNTPEEAQVLAGPSPATVNGNAEVADEGGVTITFTDGSSDDLEDLFKITTTAPGLNITLDGLVADCDLYLINGAADAVLGGSLNTGLSAEEIDDPALPAGTYFIGVSIYDPDPGMNDTTPYTLTVTGALGEAGEAVLQAYRVYRSTTASARQTGTMIDEVAAGVTAFTDPLSTDGNFFYQVTALYDQGESAPSNEATVAVSVDTEAEPGLPETFVLAQNYPNPFNPETRIAYTLPAFTSVRLDVYNLMGQRVRTLVDTEQAAGAYTVRWDGRTDSGASVATGVYVYRLKAGVFEASRKLVLLR